MEAWARKVAVRALKIFIALKAIWSYSSSSYRVPKPEYIPLGSAIIVVAISSYFTFLMLFFSSQIDQKLNLIIFILVNKEKNHYKFHSKKEWHEIETFTIVFESIIIITFTKLINYYLLFDP